MCIRDRPHPLRHRRPGACCPARSDRWVTQGRARRRRACQSAPAAVVPDDMPGGRMQPRSHRVRARVCRRHTMRVTAGGSGVWQAVVVAEPHAVSDTDDADEAAALEALVGDWSYLPDIAARYGVPLSRVRRHLADRELLTHRVGPNRAAVPSDGPRDRLGFIASSRAPVDRGCARNDFGSP